MTIPNRVEIVDLDLVIAVSEPRSRHEIWVALNLKNILSSEVLLRVFNTVHHLDVLVLVLLLCF